ncbi:unnamed protein product, partial [Urochloa humidicola]
ISPQPLVSTTAGFYHRPPPSPPLPTIATPLARCRWPTSPPPTAGSQPLDPRLPARCRTPHPLLDPALVHRRTSPLSTPGAATRPCACGSPLLTPDAPRRTWSLGSPAAGAQSLRTPALLPAAAGFCRPRRYTRHSTPPLDPALDAGAFHSQPQRHGRGDRWEHAAARAPCSYASTVRRRWPDLQELAASRLSPPRVLKQVHSPSLPKCLVRPAELVQLFFPHPISVWNSRFLPSLQAVAMR